MRKQSWNSRLDKLLRNFIASSTAFKTLCKIAVIICIDDSERRKSMPEHSHQESKIARSQYLCMEMCGSCSWSHAIAFCRIDKSHPKSKIHACLPSACHLAPSKAPSLEYSDRVATPQPLNFNWMDRGDCGTRRLLFLFPKKTSKKTKKKQ
jgi:hypothetical protein